MRRSRAYSGFKAVNGVLFIVLGCAIVVRIINTAGLRVEAIPGLLLGAAMTSLGIYRTIALLRARSS